MMKINFIGYFLTAFLVLSSCQSRMKHTETDYSIIPFPNKLSSQLGNFTLQGEMSVALSPDSASLPAFNYLVSCLKNTSILLKQVNVSSNNSISFVTDTALTDEAYALTITPNKIELKANQSGSGFFYGIQSLLQLMPADIYSTRVEDKLTTIQLPAVVINDTPRFTHRGAMVDVCRYFMPKEFILKFIDQMAKLKLNRFHFHLTNDQGWRIEIKKYPKLTEVGSVRKQTLIGNTEYYLPHRYDGKEHKGFYTQEEIKEIIRYAEERFITVIPEIEMPGHASAALASYPELSCGLGKTYTVREYGDVFDEVFCPKEQTFNFLQDVLTEVIELFPSHYIHIGGDECPKKAWKVCDHCQTLMKQKGLKNEEELQSWFIHRIEKFVNSKGRDIIGWDEILEGGLAPNATVMSWRGEKGGIEAAKAKHKVIMTPGKYCYLDYYQEDPEFALLSIGNFLPLDTVYSYNPIPSVLSPEEQTYIIGAQGNLWSEYIPNASDMEYMAFPRLQAMAEVLWTQPIQKNFDRFTKILAKDFVRMDYEKINACRNFFEVNFFSQWNKVNHAYEVELKSFYPDADIYYSLTDSVVTPTTGTLYQRPIKLTKDATIYAVAAVKRNILGKVTHKGFVVNRATGCNYTCAPEAGWEHINKGFGLTDGRLGYPKEMRHWVSFYQDTVRITIDLRKEQQVEQVTVASLFRPWSAIWPAREMSVSVSIDDKSYTPVGTRKLTPNLMVTEITRFSETMTFPVTQAAFIRLTLLSGGICPKGYFQEGQQSELAIDEIEIQ